MLLYSFYCFWSSKIWTCLPSVVVMTIEYLLSGTRSVMLKGGTDAVMVLSLV